MTYFKLALRNARRQARDYLAYFATVVLAAALLYAFNGLVFSREVQDLSRSIRNLPLVVVLASAVVVWVFGWLVSYATGFMLSCRSRELGTYVLIGLENRQVARLFFLENLAVGSFALALGLLLGALLFQCLWAIVLALFGQPYRLSLVFSLPAMGLTLAYFVLIYLRALLKCRKRIRKMKIYDLIYYDRQNEGVVLRTGRGRRRTFSLSLVLGAVGTVLLMAGDLTAGLIGAGCVIVFLYGFFLSFASGVPAFFEKRPAWKYRGRSLLVFRTLTAKLAAMGVLMATISMIFTATIAVEGTGLVFRGIYEGRTAESTCFDLFIGIPDREQDASAYLDYIDGHIPTAGRWQYQVYQGETGQLLAYLDAHTNYYPYDYDFDPVLRWSDYAALRTLAGYPAAELEPGEYLIHCMSYVEKALRAYGEPVTLSGITLRPGGVYTEPFFQGHGTGNGRGYILVVPDEAAAGLTVRHRACAFRTVQPVTEEQYAALTRINADKHRHNPREDDFLCARSIERAETAAMTAMTVFPLYFLALAMTMTAAAILTLQQLSEAGRWRRQFDLLQKLGMDRREMGGVLRTQFSIYYALPVLPALLVSVPFLLNLASLPEPGVMVGANSPAAILAIALGVFFLVYAIYIALAYTSLKRSVLPSWAV